MQTTFINYQHVRAVIGFMFVMAWAGAAPAQAQTVAQLLQPNTERTNLRMLLAAWGDEAVGPTVAAIQHETDANPVRLGVLMHALRDVETPVGEAALRSLLSDTRPYVRGTAAKLLAERHARCSVPALTALLADSAEFGKTRQGQTLQSVSVATIVAEALAAVTAVPPASVATARAAQYEGWWTAHAASLSCGGGQ